MPTTPAHAPVEGAPLYSYGHSYTVYPSPYTTPGVGEYMERVRTRLGMGPGFFRGRSGTPLQDTVCGMLSSTFLPPIGLSGDRTWVPGSRGIVLFQNYMNECSGAAGYDALYRQAWKRALRTAFALISSRGKLHAGGMTRTGTWTAVSASSGADRYSAQNLYLSQTAGDKIAFNVAGDECWLVHGVGSPAYDMSDLRVYVDGTLIKTIACQGQMQTFTSVDGTSKWHSPVATKLTGLNAAAGTTGNKTVTVVLASSKRALINCVLLPMAKPPRIFYGLEPERNPAGTNQDSVAAFDANHGYFEQLAAEVVGEFDNAHLVYLDQGWNNATMVGALDVDHNFHPGDLGMQHIADKFVEAIVDRVTSPDAGVLTL